METKSLIENAIEDIFKAAKEERAKVEEAKANQQWAEMVEMHRRVWREVRKGFKEEGVPVGMLDELTLQAVTSFYTSAGRSE